MRIIAGEHRGRRLLGPVDKATTRPITDRVKTALFDRLAAADRLAGARVLDCFAGTGSMGLECLSRGAAQVTFIERDRVALDRLRKNLRAIDRYDDAAVLTSDALAAGLVDALPGKPYQLLFIDPPYRMMTDRQSAAKVLEQMARLRHAASDDAVLVLRTDSHVEVDAVAGWRPPQAHRYGSMWLHFFEPDA